jgi:predicted RNA binding protein YcfA (HicA-like mRNA interferase family)
MPKSPLRNIPLQTFREYLKWMGLEYVRTSGGHEIWKKQGLTRSIVLQTHKDPVPMPIVKSILITLEATAESYIDFLKS